MATDEDIEREIKAKGLTAPRVTPESIVAKIMSEHYFTARDGCNGTDDEQAIPGSLARLTICILVLENGFTILGKSAPASASNFDPELGKKIARGDAINQIWPLEGYLLREQLHQEQFADLDKPLTPLPPLTDRELIGGSVEADAVYRFAGWLTSRDEVLTASAKHEAGPWAEAVDQFLKQPKKPLGATTGVE